MTKLLIQFTLSIHLFCLYSIHLTQQFFDRQMYYCLVIHWNHVSDFFCRNIKYEARIYIECKSKRFENKKKTPIAKVPKEMISLFKYSMHEINFDANIKLEMMCKIGFFMCVLCHNVLCVLCLHRHNMCYRGCTDVISRGHSKICAKSHRFYECLDSFLAIEPIWIIWLSFAWSLNC